MGVIFAQNLDQLRSNVVKKSKETADTKSKSEIYHQATKVKSQKIQNFSLVLLRLGKYRKCSFFTVTTHSMSGQVYILQKSVT